MLLSAHRGDRVEMRSTWRTRVKMRSKSATAWAETPPATIQMVSNFVPTHFKDCPNTSAPGTYLSPPITSVTHAQRGAAEGGPPLNGKQGARRCLKEVRALEERRARIGSRSPYEAVVSAFGVGLSVQKRTGGPGKGRVVKKTEARSTRGAIETKAVAAESRHASNSDLGI